MTDLAKKFAPIEKTFEIGAPNTGEPVGIRVTLMSPDDPRMKGIKRKISDANLKKQSRRKTLKTVEIEKNEIELFSAAMTGWEWYGDDVVFQGKKPDFTPKMVAKVLTVLPWFAQQISDELDETTDFFTK